jgi:aspartate aminotransferase
LNHEDLDKQIRKIKKFNRLLILNSPNNPSGTIHKNFKDLAKVVKENNILVISDEIYAELDFSGEYKSLTHLCPENTIISNGLSKWCGAGGWRIGYLVFPENLDYIKDTIRSIASETYTSVSAPIQYATIKAFTEDHSLYLKNSRLILKMISEYIYKELLSVGVKCQRAEGGFYLICDFSKKIKKTNQIIDSESLCNKILNETGFAMLPGSDFGLKNEKLLSRIAFVDFDGKKALHLLIKDKNVNLKKICPKIIKGINKLKEWIIKN